MGGVGWAARAERDPGRPAEVRSNEEASILPAQRASAVVRGMGERRLLWAVLGQALHDLALVRAGATSLPRYRRKCGRRGANVEAWFFSPDDTWALSLDNLCGHLGLDAGALRRAVAAGRR
jgi:hypothetical protein